MSTPKEDDLPPLTVVEVPPTVVVDSLAPVEDKPNPHPNSPLNDILGAKKYSAPMNPRTSKLKVDPDLSSEEKLVASTVTLLPPKPMLASPP